MKWVYQEGIWNAVSADIDDDLEFESDAASQPQPTSYCYRVTTKQD
jgi:hypothetical protein